MPETQHSENTLVFICGSALSGQPDHDSLSGARLLGTVQSLPGYRMHAVADDWHPGIFKVDQGGVSIAGELYSLTPEQYQTLLDSEPPNMSPDKIELADGTHATAMFYPQALIEKHAWPDISAYGGWAAYKAAQNPS